jgi:L-aminopeptidase/D-esterase-like protein
MERFGAIQATSHRAGFAKEDDMPQPLPGIAIGHRQDLETLTGCTVLLPTTLARF